MNSNDFIELYFETVNLLDIYNQTIEFFSNEIPDEIKENEDIEEIILDIYDSLLVHKEFDKLIYFIELIKNKHKEYHDNLFIYFNDFLIKYNLSLNKFDLIYDDLKYFIDNPNKDLSIYNKVTLNLLFYQQTDILNKIVENNLEMFIKDEDISLNSYRELSQFVIIENFENAYVLNHDYTNINNYFYNLIIQNIDISNSYINSFVNGLKHDLPDFNSFKNNFSKSYNEKILNLCAKFCIYMQSKGFKFYLSNFIWENYFSYLFSKSNNVKQFEDFIKIDKISFKKFITKQLQHQYNDFSNYFFTILWGAQYVYDFIYEINYIDKQQYLNAKNIILNVKGLAINHYINTLWQFNYIHQWQKPTGVNEAEFMNENDIFIKTYSNEYSDFDDIKDVFSKELSGVGDLSKYITSNEELYMIERNTVIDDLIKVMNHKKNKNKNELPKEAIIKKNLPGRNDPCICGSGKKYKKCCGK